METAKPITTSIALLNKAKYLLQTKHQHNDALQGELLLDIISYLGESTGVESLTYAQLKTKYDAGALVPFRYYNITDFRSVMLVPGQVFTNVSVRDADIPEHSLIVQAASTTALYPEAFDTEFPTDTVHYDITGKSGGVSYPSDGTERGWIYYREFQSKDRQGVNKIYGYDLRNTVVALYAINGTTLEMPAIAHCILSATSKIGFSPSAGTFVENSVVALDTTPYDAVTNTDGVKYLFSINNTRNLENQLVKCTFNIASAGRPWEAQRVPPIYWSHPVGGGNAPWIGKNMEIK